MVSNNDWGWPHLVIFVDDVLAYDVGRTNKRNIRNYTIWVRQKEHFDL